MEKNDLFELACGVIFVFLLGVVFSLVYIEINNRGYYCEYCKEPGIYKHRIDSERHLGSHKCSVSPNEKHTVKFYWKDPRNKPEYINYE